MYIVNFNTELKDPTKVFQISEYKMAQSWGRVKPEPRKLEEAVGFN
jgi:hypothetical protein